MTKIIKYLIRVIIAVIITPVVIGAVITIFACAAICDFFDWVYDRKSIDGYTCKDVIDDAPSFFYDRYRPILGLKEK